MLSAPVTTTGTHHRSALWPLVLMVLLVVGAWSVWDTYIDYKQALEQEYRLLEVRAAQHDARISGALRSVDLMLGSIIDDLRDHPTMPVAEQNKLLRQYLRQLPEIDNLLITDAAGRIRADTYEKIIGIDVAHREYFKTHRDAPGDDRFHVSAPFTTVIGRISTTESRVFRDAQGRFAGVVVATLDSSFFNGALRTSLAEKDVQAVLINHNGDIINIFPRNDSIGKNLKGGIAYTEHRQSGQSMTRHMNANKFTEATKMAVFHDLQNVPLTVIVSRDYGAVIDVWRRSLYAHLGGFLLLLVTTMFFFWLAARRQNSLLLARQEIAEREEELRTIIEAEPECVKQLGADGSVLQMNQAGLRMIEADSLDQVLGRKAQQLVAEDYRDAFVALNRKVFAGESGDLTYPIRGLKGGLRWLETRAVPLRDSQQNIKALLGVTRDITERKKAEHALQEQQAQLRAILDSALDAVVGIDAQGRVIEFNPMAEKIFGWTKGEILGQRMVEILVPAQHRAAHQHGIDRFLATRTPKLINQRTEITALRRDGSEFPIELSITAVRRDDVDIFTAYVRDITERKKMEDQVRQLAFHDALTTLPNRRLFDDRLNHAMAASQRRNRHGALMFLDLDNFKPLNDTHGHEFGDLLLIEAATRLKICVREQDTVGRFGGDEFVVLISELDADRSASASHALLIAEKIRNTLSKPYVLTAQHKDEAAVRVEHCCTASIGVALFFDHDISEDELYFRADAAMYQAKQGGRNAVCIHDPVAASG